MIISVQADMAGIKLETINKMSQNYRKHAIVSNNLLLAEIRLIKARFSSQCW